MSRAFFASIGVTAFMANILGAGLQWRTVANLHQTGGISSGFPSRASSGAQRVGRGRRERLQLDSGRAAPWLGRPWLSRLAPTCWASGRMRYSAFISYNHADKAAATWLHRALETYRFPRRLRGRSSPFGQLGARLPPVFR